MLCLVTLVASNFVFKPIKLQVSAGLLAALLVPRLESTLEGKIHLSSYSQQFFPFKGQIPSCFFLPLFTFQYLERVVFYIFFRVEWITVILIKVSWTQTFFWVQDFLIVFFHCFFFSSCGTVGKKRMCYRNRLYWCSLGHFGSLAFDTKSDLPSAVPWKG